MEAKMFVLVLFSLQIASSSTQSIMQGNETDSISLVAFKNRVTYDPSGSLGSWNHTTHFCNWYGVSCGSRRHPQRVTSLNLSSMGLVGSISPSIANLSFLQILTLDENNFFGTIPPEIGKLRRLQFLRLSNNSLDGTIPVNLANCTRLSMLAMNGNNLSGTIPVELGSLPDLAFIYLTNNGLTGKIPSSIANISSLQWLALVSNQLEGSIPNEIGNLKSLQCFQVSINKLSGTIPSSLFNLSSLLILGVAVNELEGSLPPNMGMTLPNLQIVLVGGNRFRGPIPHTLPNASNLYYIDMSSNIFSGKLLPNFGRLGSLSYLNLESNQLEASDANSRSFLTSLANCSQLRLLSLAHNNLSGELPYFIGNLSTQLRTLMLNANQLVGNIPSELENLVNISILSVGQNQLSYTIPESIGKLKKLQYLGLYKNMLVGNIPSTFSNLTQLLYLYLHENMLDGPLSPNLGNLQQLQDLGLANNKFSGIIPKEVFSISSLRVCNLSHNSLVGRLPFEVSGMKSLTSLYMSGNKLVGKIPSTLGDCQFLENLELKQNLFEGNIPLSLGNLKGLQLLDLSQNNLAGPIPEFLGSLNLTSLNLSFNHFEGEVPNKGIFRNSTAISLLGNNGLCGGILDLHLPRCPLKSAEKKGMSLLFKTIVAIASIFFLALLFGCIHLFYRSKVTRAETSILPSSEDKCLRASYIELERATDGFSYVNLIGTGGCGSVYKGSLDHGSTFVAVKVFKLNVQGASRSFIDECEALRNIRHRNLVKIITTCSTIDSGGNDFKALIFEYMPNGNLDTWLHVKKNLTLIQRLSIAVDVANALHYMHFDCDAQVIHCDLKPSNILLNEVMVAHVGDFGLARLLPKIGTPFEDSSCSIGLRGTIGYVAPEYGVTGEVSSCADAYSYGILLLELFTGLKPTSELFKDGHSLHMFVKMASLDKVMDIVDPVLMSQKKNSLYNSNKTGKGPSSRSRIQECIASVMTIGLLCSNESPRERINMRVAAAKLLQIKNSFLRDGFNEEY